MQDQIAELKEQSAGADRAVEAFKEKNNMISADGKLVNEQQVAELSTQLVGAKKRTSDAQSRLDRIQTILRGDTVDATVTDSLNNVVVTKLRENASTMPPRKRIGPHGSVQIIRRRSICAFR